MSQEIRPVYLVILVGLLAGPSALVFSEDEAPSHGESLSYDSSQPSESPRRERNPSDEEPPRPRLFANLQLPSGWAGERKVLEQLAKGWASAPLTSAQEAEIETHARTLLSPGASGSEAAAAAKALSKFEEGETRRSLRNALVGMAIRRAKVQGDTARAERLEALRDNQLNTTGIERP